MVLSDRDHGKHPGDQIGPAREPGNAGRHLRARM
jgi:hypothetical protein